MVSMKTWEQVRQMHHNQGKSIRQIARETGHARKTIEKLINQLEPPAYKRKRPYLMKKMGQYHHRLEEMVAENKRLPKKQRWTTPRMFEQLVAEGYEGAESTVRHHVADIRKEKQAPASYIPLMYEAGHAAQVDWGEAVVTLNGEVMKIQTFHMTLSYSRCHFMMGFPSQKQECFAAGHVAAFDFFDGIPGRISYDNLKTAVKELLVGKERVEQQRFIALRSHYLFQSHYCAPAAGHEKGIVEGMVGFGRRRFLSPPPEFSSFDDLNDYLAQKCRADMQRQVHGQPKPIGEMFAEEQKRLNPIPSHPFECCRVTPVNRNRYSQIRVETNSYSVPADLAAKQLTAKLFPFEVRIYRPNQKEAVAIHLRSYEQKEMVCDWMHYLPLLKKRPHALPYARPLKGWRESWPAIYGRLYDQLERLYPTREQYKIFIDILYLRRSLPAQQLEWALEQALEHHVPHLEGVSYWIRRYGLDEETHIPPADLSQLAHLTQIGTTTGTTAVYDQLRLEVPR
jgi:transposase